MWLIVFIPQFICLKNIEVKILKWKLFFVFLRTVYPGFAAYCMFTVCLLYVFKMIYEKLSLSLQLYHDKIKSLVVVAFDELLDGGIYQGPVLYVKK